MRNDRPATQADVLAEVHRLGATGLLDFELANVCVVKMRRHPRQRSALMAAFRLRGRLRVEEIVVDLDRALEMAVATGLTANDASCLWLAPELGAELVAPDRQVAAAVVR